jgi:hypothetical protein
MSEKPPEPRRKTTPKFFVLIAAGLGVLCLVSFVRCVKSLESPGGRIWPFFLIPLPLVFAAAFGMIFRTRQSKSGGKTAAALDNRRTEPEKERPPR